MAQTDQKTKHEYVTKHPDLIDVNGIFKLDKLNKLETLVRSMRDRRRQFIHFETEDGHVWTATLTRVKKQWVFGIHNAQDRNKFSNNRSHILIHATRIQNNVEIKPKCETPPKAPKFKSFNSSDENSDDDRPERFLEKYYAQKASLSNGKI